VLFESYVQQHEQVFREVSRDQIKEFIDGLRLLRASKGTLWVVGNGGSAATASHVVADFNKTILQFGKPSLKTFCISDMVPLSTALANDIDFESAIAESLEMFASKKDGLLVLSVSGTSPNLLRALSRGGQIGMKRFAIVGAGGKETASDLDFKIVVPSTDYQIVENIHLLLLHYFTKVI